MADEVKNKGIKGLNLTPRQMEKLLEEYDNDLKGSISERELEILLNRLEKKAGKEEKDSKPKKDPVTGAEYLYAKKGGLVKKSKSKVAGKLAIRGYGKAMKGKK